MQTLPPITVLTAWRGEIDQANKICSNHFYIPTDHGFYDLDSIRDSIKLLEAKEIKDAVRQEIEWFSSEMLSPKSEITCNSGAQQSNERGNDLDQGTVSRSAWYPDRVVCRTGCYQTLLLFFYSGSVLV